MTEQLDKQHNELAKLIESHAGQDGVYETAIPSFVFIRRSNVTGPIYGVQRPSFCIVVQGAKEVLLAQERYLYNPAEYLVASVDLPIIGKVTEASPDVPYLGLKLEFKLGQIVEVLRDTEFRSRPKENAKRAMFVSRLEVSILDAVLRLARLIETPQDIPVLAPLFTKEILYKILQGPHGVVLEQIAVEGGSTHRVSNVIAHIMSNFDRSFKIEDLAEIANMSVSSLHRHFKEVTAMKVHRNSAVNIPSCSVFHLEKT